MPPISISSEGLELILSHFAISIASFNGMLAAVAHFHAQAGLTAPTTAPCIKLLVRGSGRAFGRPLAQCCPLVGGGDMFLVR